MWGKVVILSISRQNLPVKDFNNTFTCKVLYLIKLTLFNIYRQAHQPHGVTMSHRVATSDATTEINHVTETSLNGVTVTGHMIGTSPGGVTATDHVTETSRGGVTVTSHASVTAPDADAIAAGSSSEHERTATPTMTTVVSDRRSDTDLVR